MKRYADPLRCPDCSGAIGHGTTACPACGLTLTGEVAQALFTTLSRADELLAALRTIPLVEPTPLVEPGETRPTPSPVEPVGTRPARGLSAASVPKILLSLGAACLLVAALVFLAVTWSVMGVGGRTATLVGFTAVAGALAGWGARRGLRAATESLGLVALGLLTLDLFGARNAGWLGDLSLAGFLVLLGLVLAVVSAASALAVRRTATGALTGAEVVTAVGTGLAGAGMVGLDVPGDAAGLVVAVLLGLGVTATTWRLRLRVATALSGIVTAGAWLALTGYALVRAGEHRTVHALWAELEVWPLLAAAALVSALAPLGTSAVSRVFLAGGSQSEPIRLPVRVGAAAVGYVLVVVAVVMPVLDESATAVTVAALGVLAATGPLAWFVRRPWALVGMLAQGVAGTAVAVVAVGLVLRSVERLLSAGADAWTGAAGDRLPGWSDLGLPEPWVLPLVVAGVAGTALALARAAGGDRARALLLDPIALASVAVLTVVATLGLYPVPLWVEVAVLVVAAAAGAVAWSRHQHVVLLGLVLLALVAGLVPALHAEGLSAVVLVAALAIGSGVHLRAGAVEQAEAAGLALAVTTAALVWTGGALMHAPWASVALAGLLLLGVLVLVAPAAPDRWWACAAVPARTGLEAGAGAAAVPLGVAGTLLAPVSEAASWTAVYLTVTGVVVAAMSLIRADRRSLGWAGGALLALASWVRLQDIGVHTPEAYTLPSAVALLVVGLVHLHRVPRTTTMRALSPGLGLALVPSLLWALDEPVSLRALLLGGACFALVVAGVRARSTAPLLWGALVGLLLVLRLAAPYVGQAVPRWVLIGTAGAALIAMGVTWERRRADARHLISYVRALR